MALACGRVSPPLLTLVERSREPSKATRSFGLNAGYDKGKEPSSKRQNTEIKRAKQRLTRWKAEQDRLAEQARLIGGVSKRRGKRRS
jgi:hypothetical protein